MSKSSDLTADEAPLSRGSAADQVFVKLRDQILQGTLERGARLPSERELAQHYHVSPPTIREAVRGLASVHLVEVRHGTGIYVTAEVDALFALATSALLQVERVQLVDILDILEMLYVKCAGLACAKASDAELESLAAAVEKIDGSTEVEGAVTALRAFLHQLADAGHNALISHLCRFLVGLLTEILREQLAGNIANWANVGGKLRSERRSLVEALRERDLERATKSAVQYHRHARNLVRERLAAAKGDSDQSMQRAFARLRRRGPLS